MPEKFKNIINTSIYLEASDPEKNIWVSASAGSGKTKTLTDRFLRLILCGVAPDKILCVTFTKIAASEMLTRIRETLAQWSALSEDLLKKELKMLDQPTSPQELQKARGLFSYFIENQENLQIQTIHSFCQKLISTFPLEAGLKINPEIITDYKRSELLEKTKDSFLENYEKELSDPTFLSYLLSNIHELTLEELLEKASYISNISNSTDKEIYIKKCYDSLNTTPEICTKKLITSEQELLRKIKSSLNLIESNSADDLTPIILACLAFLKEKKLEDLRSTFLTITGSPRKTLIKKKNSTLFPELSEALISIRDLVYEHTQNEAMKHTLYCTLGFIDLLFLFNQYFTELKKDNGYLDYNDIISVSLKMLENKELSSWIDTKLNAKIEHVMVDESQDVNLKQWQIIHTCIKDFFSSTGSTIFIVGDQKQSIYSFQGSSPEMFSGMKQLLHNRSLDFNKKISSLNFQKSFRSDKLVLDFVDSVFKKIDQIDLNYFCENNVEHVAHKNFDHASVELWPLFINTREKNETNEWDITTEYQEPYTPSKSLANLIAEKIESLINTNGFTPADFMILVRKRDSFSRYIVNALKEKKIPVSGMDRIVSSKNLAIKDLISLMQFIVTPEDDYNLACLLKSPLFNITEEDLLNLCQREDQTLWENLEKKPEIQQYLSNLLQNPEIHQPYTLASYCLDIQRKRKDFLSSLGAPVDEILDEFLEVCLEFERSKTSSLSSFIQWFHNSNVEVKKEFDGLKNEVKVMTIHASKGLQAKYVILPDTTTVPKNQDRILFDQLNDTILYNVSENHNAEYQEHLQNLKLRTLQEYYRLLYVGLTRAKTNILICGHSNTESISELSWYHIIQETIRDVYEKQKCDSLYGYQKSDKRMDEQNYFISNSDYIYIKEHGNPKKQDPEENQIEKETPIPHFLSEYYQDHSHNISVSPSEKASKHDVSATALEIGKLAHKILEYFVPLQRNISKKEIEDFCKIFHKKNLHVKLGANLIQNLSILINNHLLPIVSQQKIITELKISKKYISENRVYEMFGAMDLVILGKNEIYIIDYKTDKDIPKRACAVPEKYVKQMSLYKDMMQSSYPNKKISCYLAWTHKPGLTKLDNTTLPDFKTSELI